MASITLTGTLLDPTGEVAVGDQIRFTHRTTTGETIQNARSIIIIPPTGLYNFPLEFGLIFVEYLDIKDVNYKSLGVVTVNQDSTATDLPGLLNAIVPPTDAQLLLFQGILADTEDARDIALLAAAQQTMLELIASTTTHPAGTVLTLSGETLSGDGGGGKWKLNGVVGQTVSQSPTDLDDFLLNDGNGNQWALVFGQILAFDGTQYLPLPFGSAGNGNYSYDVNGWDKVAGFNDLSQAYTFKTVALMQSSLIIFPVGKKIFWQGYYAESDGGSNWGIVISGAHTDDGGSIFTLADGKFVEANLKSNKINTAKFGASNALADNADFINNAITYAESLGRGVVTIGSAQLRVVEKFSETRNGVTIRYAIKIKPKVRLTGSKIGELLYAGTGVDTVSNQFTFVSNDTTEVNFSGYYIDRIRCINDGLALAYVNGIEIFGGNASKNAGWLNDVRISKIHGVQTRLLVKFNHDRVDGVYTIKGITVSKLSGVSVGSAVLNLTSVENGSVSSIDCDTSAFDIITAFHTKGFNIRGITGKDISENIILVECQLAGQAHSDLNISDVVSTSGKMTIATSNATTSIKDVKYSNIQCPTFIIDNSDVNAGLVSGLTIDATIKTPGGVSRGLFVNNASNIIANVQVKGSPTLAGAEVINSDNVTVNGDIAPDTNVNCLVLQQARKTKGKVSLRGGLNGVFLKGTGGSMGGVELEVDCAGQSAKAVDFDGVSSSSHKVHIHGTYDGQDINYGQVTGSFIELQTGVGADLTITSDALPRPTNQIHYANAETGTTDDVQSITGGILGQKITVGAVSGDTLTFKHATGGGNIRTLAAGDVTVTDNNTITLLFNGTNHTQV